MTRNILKIGIGLLLMTSVYGCGASSTNTALQQQPEGVVIGKVGRIKIGPPIDEHKTLIMVADKGTNDGVSVGTIGHIRIHKAALMEYRVEAVSDTTSEIRGWHYPDIKPGHTVIFNVGKLSFDQLFKISDSLLEDTRPASKRPEKEPPRQQRTSEFVSFMRRFYPAYKANEWPEMQRLSRDKTRSSRHFKQLVESAQLQARPGIKEVSLDWSDGDFLAPHDTVKIALSILASSQRKLAPKEAELSSDEQKILIDLWGTLYVEALHTIGGPATNRPADTRMPRDKLHSAYSIAQLIGEPALEALSLVGQAWLAERTGDMETAGKLRKRATASGKGYIDHLPWPPINVSGVVEIIEKQ